MNSSLAVVAVLVYQGPQWGRHIMSAVMVRIVSTVSAMSAISPPVIVAVWVAGRLAVVLGLLRSPHPFSVLVVVRVILDG